MSNLLSTTEGISAAQVVQGFLLKRRMSRFFKRNLVIAYNKWLAGNGFDLSTLIGSLNAAHDTEILNLFRLLGIAGSLPVSVQDTTIYVDSVAGNDSTGDGTQAKPFKTLWFLDTLPKKIVHTYIVAIVNDVSGGSFMLSNEFGNSGANEGSLSFVGVGAPEVVQGPFEVAAVGTLSGGFGQYIQMTTAIGANPQGNFLIANDGINAGNAQAIHSLHGTDTLILPFRALPSLAPGDSVSIVRPARQITVSSFVCCGKGPIWSSSVVNDGARIVFGNIRINITNTNPAQEAMIVDNRCVQLMSFCQVVAPPNGGSWLVKSDLNTKTGDTIAEVVAASGVENIIGAGAEANQRPAGLAILDTGITFTGVISGCRVKFLSNRQRIDLKQRAELELCTSARFSALQASGLITGCVCQGRTASGNTGAGLELDTSDISIDGLIVLNSENVITIRKNSRVSVSGAGADPTYSTISHYGVRFVGTGVVEVDDDGALLVGATNAVQFDTVNPAVAGAIPAAYGWLSDAQGGALKRLST